MDNSHFKEIKVMLDYTFEETKGKTIFLKLDEDGDEATEYFEVNTIEDYKFISDIYKNLYYIKPKFKITDIINYLDKKNEK